MFLKPKLTFCWIFLCTISIYFLPRSFVFAGENVDPMAKPIHNFNVERNNSGMIATSACIFKYFQTYSADQRSLRKSIHLLRNNIQGHFQSNEEKFLIEFHRMKFQRMSIQLENLYDPTDFGHSEPNSVQRRDYIWFLNDIPKDHDIDQLVQAVSADAAHLHVVCARRLPDEQISNMFEILSRSFRGNVNALMAHDVDKWKWYSHGSFGGQCDSSVMLAKAEFHWKCNRCVRVDESHHVDLSKASNERCLLRVGSIHLPPYTYYDEKRGFHKGIEYFMIETIAKKLNHDVVYRFINATEYYEVMEISDVFGDLSDG